MSEIGLIILALCALLTGAAIGWLMGSKTGRSAGAQVADMLRLQLDGVAGERDGARGELADMRTMLDTAKMERAALSAKLAAVEAQALERDRAYAAAQDERDRQQDSRIAELKAFNEEAKKQLSAQFGDIGARLLGEAQKQFLERADQRFHQAGEKNEERLKQLMAPVGESLKKYEERVALVESQRTEAYGNLTGLIAEMKQGQERVSTEAAKLVNSLRNAPKARGRWGEQQLKNVLESCGLTEHTDFVTEVSVSDGEGGRLRPDAIIRTPGGGSLVVDAKVSLNDYQDAFAADDETAREAFLARHCASMRAHIDGLSRKAYWDQFAAAPDYVILFVPGEHFLAAALEHDPHMWDHAFEKRVLLATPTNLVAIARTVAGIWRQEKMGEQAREIGMLGKEMYDRLAVAAEHLKRVGAGLTSAVGNYNKFVGSFERNVLSTGRKFKELNIEAGKKDIDALDAVEALPRYGEGGFAEEGNTLPPPIPIIAPVG
jgi:DNA recombination protein RmuC